MEIQVLAWDRLKMFMVINVSILLLGFDKHLGVAIWFAHFANKKIYFKLLFYIWFLYGGLRYFR